MTAYRRALRHNVAAIDPHDVWAAGVLDLLHTATALLPDETVHSLVTYAGIVIAREARRRDRSGDRAGHDRLCRILNLLEGAHLSAVDHSDR